MFSQETFSSMSLDLVAAGAFNPNPTSSLPSKTLIFKLDCNHAGSSQDDRGTMSRNIPKIRR